MFDKDDREFVAMWAIRVVGGGLAVIVGAGVLGLAWRVFELIAP